jgi:1-aminocyclopropane-1-carboxylate deaminase/D-cysteine desulfhydrase-like pyridoxal-dependent ACC family enzyme
MIMPNLQINFVQPISHQLLTEKKVNVSLLRLDLLDANWGGNKWFKLKYHILDAITKGYKNIGSFGGPWSNHIAALAIFGKLNNLKTSGLIRCASDITKYPTLLTAKKNGMQLSFLTNDEYENSQNNLLLNNHESIYWIPSGGHTSLGIQGCEEILQLDCLQSELANFTHIAVSVGNGTTLSGLSKSCFDNQQLIAVPAFKNANYLVNELKPFIKNKNIEWWFDDHFGGFGKSTAELFSFIDFANNSLQVPLDRVYTAKLMYAIWHKIQSNYFKPNSNILVIHTGGLQGNQY